MTDFLIIGRAFCQKVTGSQHVHMLQSKKIRAVNGNFFSGDPEYLPIDEQHPTGKCTNPYGKTKFFMEEIIKDVCAANPVSKNRTKYVSEVYKTASQSN